MACAERIVVYMNIVNVKVNHIVNPMGYRMDSPVFSWVVEGADNLDPFNADYRIVISEDGSTVFDTGFAKLNPIATTLDVELAPRTQYTWTLCVKDNDGIEKSFDAGYFETGKMNEAWTAKWITCDMSVDRHPIFKCDFATAKKVKKARLYVAGLGLFEAYINGSKVGDEYLTPGCTAYDHWTQVFTYDVSSMLSEENQIGILVGDGWYRGRFGYDQSVVYSYGGNREVIAELHIEYEDGSTEQIVTDDSWTVKRSNIVSSSIYDGEVVDDTLEEIAEEKVIISNGPVSEHKESGVIDLIDRMGLPVVEKENFKGTTIKTLKDELVVDLGQNMGGLFRLKVHEPKGTKIHIQFGEILQDGNFYRDNLRTALAEYIYISDGNEHILCPHFTYYGYRYAKIEGASHYEDGDFTGFAIYSDMDFIGELTTGHDKVNKLIQNTIWGMKSNFIDVPSDCPQRDERMGWTGDAQVFSATACFLADTYTFYTKYMYDTGCEQQARGGIVPNVIPAFHDEEYGSIWGDATCIIPWNMYLYYGDETILKNHYCNMKSWVDHIASVDGDNHQWRKMYHNGDWLALDSLYPGDDQVMGGTDEGYIADIYYLKSLKILSRTAAILNKKEDAAYYSKEADRIYQGIQDEYFAPNGRCCIDTQTSCALILTENLGNKELAATRLKQLLGYRSGMLSTGFVGTNILTRALSDNGLEEQAFNLLLNEEYPGWLYEVNNGATTVWERWNSVDETGHISSTGMNSLNHYSYGAIIGWIWDSVAGIRPTDDEPGFRKVTIAPKISYKLGRLDAVYPSSAGTYKIHWDVPDLYTVHMMLTIPQGCNAIVTLPYITEGELVKNHPDNELVKSIISGCVGAGEYEITYRASKSLARIFTIEDTLNDIWCDPFASKVLVREYPKIYEYILWFRRMTLKVVLDNHKEGNEEIYKRLNDAFYEDAIQRDSFCDRGTLLVTEGRFFCHI